MPESRATTGGFVGETGCVPAGRVSMRRRWVDRLPKALAISLNLADADSQYAGRIRAAQIAGIVRLTPVAMIASCVNAVILVVTLGSMGSLQPSLIVWAGVLFSVALYYARAWMRRGRYDPNKPASKRALRRSILHGVMIGALWGAVPVMTFPGASLPIQLMIGCLSAGMMCAGGFVMATVPLAGWSYVGLVAAGTVYALLAAGATPIYLGLTALLVVYAAVVITNLTWNATLFVDHFLAEARLQSEVTARERAQAQVAHAQRMTALGELAGGIAHDFNNVLQAIDGNAALIAGHACDAEQAERLSKRILRAVERGSAISRRLLAFARQDALHAAPLEVSELFAGASDLLRHTLGSSVTLDVAFDPGVPMLLADRAQLETVIVNLASNARDAMPRGGTLTLRAEPDVVTTSRDDPPLRAGRYIRLSLRDTGTGMDAATFLRSTDPFFTTKPKGKGTGLGLSMAKGFAEQSGGALAIASAVGRGTTVTLWLPQSDATYPAGPERIAVASRPVGPGDRCNVLVVDDDTPVREAIIMSLADAGFAVSGAEGGENALDHLSRGPDVDVLLTDFAMPGMNGIELIRAAQASRPGLPAILLTGHVGDVTTLDGDRHENERFILLQKPIRPAQLVASIAEALEARVA